MKLRRAGRPLVLDSSYSPITTSQYGNPYYFTGRRWDAETGFYSFRHRYYDPTLGRFTTRDPIGIWGDALNLGNGYTYAGNSPWSYVDPWGLETWCRKVLSWGRGQAQIATDFYQRQGAKLALSENGFVSGLGVVIDTAGTTAGELFEDSLAPLDLGTATGTVAGAGGSGDEVALAISQDIGLGSQAILTLAGPATGRTGQTLRRVADDAARAADDALRAIAKNADDVPVAAAPKSRRVVDSPGGSKGSTGRTTPENLKEKLAMDQVKSSPAGKDLADVPMTDPRWPGEEGWVKVAENVNGVEIHYNRNVLTGACDDFKFK